MPPSREECVRAFRRHAAYLDRSTRLQILAIAANEEGSLTVVGPDTLIYPDRLSDENLARIYATITAFLSAIPHSRT